MRRYLDTPSIIVAAITLALFIAALFVKGITHDLFLEIGIFLVSVKLMMMLYTNRVVESQLAQKMDAILATLERMASPNEDSARTGEARRAPGED